jgi:hypothetical protein
MLFSLRLIPVVSFFCHGARWATNHELALQQITTTQHSAFEEMLAYM